MGWAGGEVSAELRPDPLLHVYGERDQTCRAERNRAQRVGTSTSNANRQRKISTLAR
jgi:hypothetical protein